MVLAAAQGAEPSLWPRVLLAALFVAAIVVIVVGLYRGRKKLPILAEFFDFLLHNKRWWLTPIIIILMLLAVLILLTANVGGFAPFIYTMW